MLRTMDYRKALQILSKDIEEIEKIIEESGSFSSREDIELKLALSKLRNLRENFELFAAHLAEAGMATPVVTAGPGEEKKEAPVHPERHLPEEKQEEEAPAEKTTPVPAVEKAEEKNQATGERTAVTSPEDKTTGSQEKEGKGPAPVHEESTSADRKEGDEKPATPPPKKKKEKKLLSDTLRSGQEYRNEQLGKEAGQDLSTKLSKRSVTDLRKIINLNDRFMFIRELFDGDKERYEETLRLLNGAATRREALSVLEGFRWDKKSEAAQRFMELVERKLAGLQDG